jgi:hypothetical protein
MCGNIKGIVVPREDSDASTVHVLLEKRANTDRLKLTGVTQTLVPLPHQSDVQVHCMLVFRNTPDFCTTGRTDCTMQITMHVNRILLYGSQVRHRILTLSCTRLQRRQRKDYQRLHASYSSRRYHREARESHVRGKIDLIWPHYRVLIEEHDIHKTAFKASFGKYEWLVIPHMGLQCRPWPR